MTESLSPSRKRQSSETSSLAPGTPESKPASGGWGSKRLLVRLTLIALILYGSDYWHVRPVLTILAAAGLLSSALARSPKLWMLLTAAMASGLIHNWHTADNHKYLLTYWTLAVLLSLRQPAPGLSLARHGRLLIGLCFTFATIWKIASPDFRNGSFYAFTFLTDDRFTAAAQLVFNIEPEIFSLNRDALNQLLGLGAMAQAVQLRGVTPELIAVAGLAAWATILLEAGLALAFLLPFQPLFKLRNGMLILFAWLTYSVASVPGFAWTLIIMGLAQTPPRQTRLRFAYLVTLAGTELLQLPWESLFQR